MKIKLPKRQKETGLHRSTEGVVSGRQRKGQFLLRSNYLRKPLKITQRREAPRLRKQRLGVESSPQGSHRADSRVITLFLIQTRMPLRGKGGTITNFVWTKGVNLECPGQMKTYRCLAQ